MTGKRTAVQILMLVLFAGSAWSIPEEPGKYPHGKYREDCGQCHGPDAWSPARYDDKWDHGRFGFALDQGHANTPCSSCHPTLRFNVPGTNCVDCHQDVHQGEFGLDCSTCHTTSRFQDRAFFRRGHQLGQFPLTGAHITTDCDACHQVDLSGSMDYLNTPVDCEACHMSDYDEAREPHHEESGFPTDCSSCHETRGWAGADFDHSFFSLSAGHESLLCGQCHVNGLFENTANDCEACHLADYEAAESPNHEEAGFVTECAECHDIEDWGRATIDHDDFALTEGHGGLECVDCHVSGPYEETSADCEACHLSDYQEAEEPAHESSGFPMDCAMCHSASDWEDADFEHESFALSDGHDGLECSQCHGDGVFENTASDCEACHLAEYEATESPDHSEAAFVTDCAECHDITGWESATVPHDFFALSQGHGGLECSQCHVGGLYDETQADCEACHLIDYQTTVDPNHETSGYPLDCGSCHLISGWEGAEVEHSFFALEQGHGELNCVQCHTDGVFENTISDCEACHLADYEATESPDHREAAFATDCSACHDIAGWESATVPHDFFALSQGHGGLECAQCHVSGPYSETQSDCESCHLSEYQETLDPNHGVLGYPLDCTVCHSIAGWEGARAEHSFFALEQSHGGLNCVQCHTDGLFESTASDCEACHLADYETTRSPNHAEAAFATDCQACHDIGGWESAAVPHDFFALSQGHGGLECAQCHVSGPYDETQADCEACHLGDFQGTVDPDHEASGFPIDCGSCHSIAGWEGAEVEHSFFSLTQGHGGLSCNECHLNGVFQGTPSNCEDCHLTDFQSTADPDHVDAGFPTDCAECHDIGGWGDGTFDHNVFSLTQGHGGLSCNQCHGDGVFQGTPALCEDCHLTDFQSTADPDHVNAGFPTDCAECHDIGGWGDGTFDHNIFSLTQGHGGLACSQCHGDGVFQGTPALCEDCHLTDFQSTTDPDHVDAGFPTDCAECHDIGGWGDGTFDHNIFSLTQGHGGLACSQCHGDGVFQGTPALCEDCHLTDFQSTTDPDHVDAGFPTDCAECHDIGSWGDGTFDHNIFSLTQGHGGLACSQCHGDGVFQGTPTLCEDCHLTDFQSTTDPDHVNAGFPTDCAQCHDIGGWPGAPFDHNFFPLNGGHSGLTCITCHGDGVYQGTSSDCYSCHQPDYDNTMNPNHASAGFPIDCLDCHNTNQWEGATFDHDGAYFPIYSGKHKDKWDNDCASCHVVPSDFSVFSCIDCHKHDDKTKVDNDHKEVSGYSYVSAECYFCHPTGDD